MTHQNYNKAVKLTQNIASAKNMLKSLKTIQENVNRILGPNVEITICIDRVRNEYKTFGAGKDIVESILNTQIVELEKDILNMEADFELL